MGPSVRPMRDVDLPKAMEIDRESLPAPWSEAVWREQFRSPFSLYLVLEEDGLLSGYIGLRYVADEAHIITIAVRPERRCRGFARTLIRAALLDPTSSEARSFYLEVCPGNLAARRLYSALGFVRTGVRPCYYGNEDALLMTLNLWEARFS
jgi:[ribosomal protein S18]-alanine N-acetyltransferase